MAQYVVYGQVTLGVTLFVDAESKEEAFKIADEKYGVMSPNADNSIGFDSNEGTIEFDSGSLEVDWDEDDVTLNE